MTTDRTDQTIVLKDERRLGFAEYGDASGKAVFHFNGSGGSRLEHPQDLSILTDLGIRLISALTDLATAYPIPSLGGSFWIGPMISANLLTTLVNG